MTPAELKEKLQRQNRKGLALDIDETLSITARYWMKELHKKFGNPENLSVDELVKKYKYTHEIPYWMEEEHTQWIEDAMHSTEINESLELIENANHSVNKIHTILPIVAYISARPESIRDVTKQWLNKHDFPQADIILRPRDVDPNKSNTWKAAVLEEVYPEVIGIVDDNIGLAKKLSATYKGTLYLYDIDKCERNDIDIICCKTWNDVYTQISKRHSL
jgi:5'(3')-deoxyribonucleotidase